MFHLRRIYTLPLSELESRTGFRFDTVVIHCDGCAEHFLHDNLSPNRDGGSWPEHVSTIIIEGDDDIGGDCAGRECRTLRHLINRHGHSFLCIVRLGHQCFARRLQQRCVFPVDRIFRD